MLENNVLKNEERAIFALRSLYRKYGYTPFKMSKFEEYDLYVGNKDFLVSDRVITFNDTDGRLLALKPDVTLSIIKHTTDEPGVKHKVYYNENVYRISGTTGQFKEIMQMGLESIGDIDVTDIFEVVTLAAQSLSAVSSDFVLDISHMGILSAFLSEASDNELFKKEVTELISNKNAHEIIGVCSKYGVADKYAIKLSALVNIYGDMASVIERLEPLCESVSSARALSELKVLSFLLSRTELSEKIRFDFSVVHNMTYYDGIVFSGFLSGICEAALSGGEYGKLLRTMGRVSRAVGFALYLDLLSELYSSEKEYDADVLLLYDESVAATEVISKRSELIANGKSVSAQRSVPEKQRFGEILDMRRG
jgi:ATP phosphoribosyltransferase regulatory subunit